MGRILLTPQPLTPEVFAPFGDTFSWPGTPGDGSRAPEVFGEVKRIEINQGHTTRFHDLFSHQTGDDGKIITSVFRGRPRPRVIRIMERHPLGSQAFVPLGGCPWYVVVASGKERPDTFFCLLARGDQAINYHSGVWHHPLLLAEAQDFLVIDRAGPGKNLEEVIVDPELYVAEDG